jgi:hypothetical protein
MPLNFVPEQMNMKRQLDFIMQQHSIQGAAIDFTLPEAQRFPISTLLSSNPCSEDSPVPINVTSTPMGLVVESPGTTAVVNANFNTCGGISTIYIIDDVLTPCCTNMFDVVGTPTLAPVFSSEDPMVKAFSNFFVGPLFDSKAKDWTLPKTLFIPTFEALFDYLTLIKETPDLDIATLNSIYTNITAMHMSDTSFTKAQLAAAVKPVSIPSLLDGKLDEKICSAEIKLTPRSPEAANKKYLGIASVGDIEARIVRAYRMCKGTTVYVVDKVLAPCDLTQFGTCKDFSKVQQDPLVAEVRICTTHTIKST